MPFKNCIQCKGSGTCRTIVKKFSSRDCGHVLCNRCGISHDSDVDSISTENLTADDLSNLAEESEYRRLFVETSTIRNDKNEDYGDFKWDDQKALRSGVASHAIKSIQSFFANQSELKILDVGCGSGFTSVELANALPCARIWSIDPSPQVVGVNGYQNRIQAKRATMQSAGFAADSFDVVIIIGNLMLHDNPMDTIQHALNSLRSGGLLIFDFKNIRSSIRQFCIWLARLHMSRLIPDSLFTRNFVNMRFGFHERYLLDFMKTQPVELRSYSSKPPRLLEFANKSEYSSSWKGLLWRFFDSIDRWRNQQAWMQMEFVKR